MKAAGGRIEQRRAGKMANDDRSVMIGVPRDALGLTDTSAIMVAGGSHLVWSDDATSAPNSR